MCAVSAPSTCVLSSMQCASSAAVKSSVALASLRFSGRRALQLRGRAGVSVRAVRRHEADAGAALCASQPVRPFSRGARGNGVIFLFGGPVPNHQLQRTRSGGLRPPPRAAELRRWA